MKLILLSLLLTLFVSCKSDAKKELDNSVATDVDTIQTSLAEPEKKAHSNETFKAVTITQVNDTTFNIKGKARVYEATFGYNIEDGHNILKDGFVTSDAGAPAWGNFAFQVSASKVQPNSTLLLVLFEENAKDGTRQHELPIKLY